MGALGVDSPHETAETVAGRRSAPWSPPRIEEHMTMASKPLSN